ncbi:MAG: hypothetical protein QXX09_05720 [Candidatus Methanomethylicia archaeon]
MNIKNIKSLREIYSRQLESENLPRELKIIIDGVEYRYKRMDLEDETLKLRYGLNPHQSSAIYKPEDDMGFSKIRLLKTGKGGLSSNNINDGYNAMRITSYFKDKRAVSIIKHLNPAGVAIGELNTNGGWIVEEAWGVDPRASYGCVMGLNFKVDFETAEAIVKQDKYVECIFAPEYSEEALEILSKKRSLRVIEVPIPKVQDPIQEHKIPLNIRVIGNTIILEEHFKTKLTSIEKLRELDEKTETGVVTNRRPTPKEEEWMLYAWWICAEKSSNGVVLWRENKTIAVACGQQDRIGAIEIAIEKAKRNNHKTMGSVLASDGFMLPDNIPPLVEAGVTAIIQPGGSIHDEQIIEDCNKHDIAMIFTGERIFRHF